MTGIASLRRTLRRPEVHDIALAVFLLAFSLVSLWNPPPFVPVEFREADLLGVVMTATACLAVAVRRRHPVAALPVALVTSLVPAAMGYSQGLASFAALFCLYTVAAERGFRISASMAGLTVAAVAMLLAAGPYDAPLSEWASNLFVVMLTWMVGRSVRVRRARQLDLELRNRAFQEAREAETRELLVRERARTVREVQDLVAHNLTEITVQIAAARRSMQRDAGTSGQLLADAERAGRRALDELRRIGGALGDTEHPIDFEPQPDLHALGRLVERERSAGTDVSYVHGELPEGLPPGLALTAYRVVEEVLAVCRLRVDTAVTVTVEGRDATLTVAVTSEGPPAAVEWDGHDVPDVVTRLRTRVALYGGELVMATRRDGGLRVSAAFPLPVPSGTVL